MAGNKPAQLHTVSGTASIVTNPWFVGDFRQLTVSVSSSATFPHSVPLQGSNADGFQSAIPDNSWTTLASVLGISTGTLLVVDPGFRWVRLGSLASNGVSATSAYTVAYSGRDA